MIQTLFMTAALSQCPGGTCPVPTYAAPIRQAVHQTAATITQATAPKCQGERRQPVRNAIRRIFGR